MCKPTVLPVRHDLHLNHTSSSVRQSRESAFLKLPLLTFEQLDGQQQHPSTKENSISQEILQSIQGGGIIISFILKLMNLSRFIYMFAKWGSKKNYTDFVHLLISVLNQVELYIITLSVLASILIFTTPGRFLVQSKFFISSFNNAPVLIRSISVRTIAFSISSSIGNFLARTVMKAMFNMNVVSMPIFCLLGVILTFESSLCSDLPETDLDDDEDDEERQ